MALYYNQWGIGMDFKDYRDILAEQMLMCGVTRSMSKCIQLLEEYNYDLNKLY